MKRVIVILVAIVLAALVLLWPRRAARGYTSIDARWDPPVVIDSVLSPQECERLMKTADPLFSRSSLVGVNGPDATRTSETAWISKENPMARKILDRACELTGKSFENCEDLQVVRYKPGTYYKAHQDSCCEDSQACIDFEDRGGQRVGTLLVYLNDGFEDGETHFPRHGDAKMRAQTGCAIFFRPMGAEDARCHPNALHAGLPITSGTKYVCNAWVREGIFK